MKVVYMCRPEFENGVEGLRKRLLSENGGRGRAFRAAPH